MPDTTWVAVHRREVHCIVGLAVSTEHPPEAITREMQNRRLVALNLDNHIQIWTTTTTPDANHRPPKLANGRGIEP